MDGPDALTVGKPPKPVLRVAIEHLLGAGVDIWRHVSSYSRQQSPEQQEFEEDVDLGGRPKEGPKYNSQTSARGRDPIGRDERRRDGSGSLGSNKNKFNGHSPLAREIKSKLKLKGKKLFLEKNDNEGLLDENNLLDVKK